MREWCPEKKPPSTFGSRGCTTDTSSVRSVDKDFKMVMRVARTAWNPSRQKQVFLWSVGGTAWDAACKTLFSWTNETMNAWTMLPGVFVACAALLHAT